MSRASAAMTAALVGYAARQGERDEDTVAEITGRTEELRRARAVAVFGSDNRTAAIVEAGYLRRQAERTGRITPEDAARLVAAEIVEGRRTEIGREVEALIAEEGV